MQVPVSTGTGSGSDQSMTLTFNIGIGVVPVRYCGIGIGILRGQRHYYATEGSPFSPYTRRPERLVGSYSL